MRAIETMLDWIGAACLAVLMLLIVSDGLGRYLFLQPVHGAVEIAEMYLIPAIVFLAMAATQREWGNIRIDILADRLPDWLQRAVNALILAAAGLLLAAIAWGSGSMALELYRAGAVTDGFLPLPTSVGPALVAFGTAAAAVRLAIQTVLVALGAISPREAAQE